MSVPLQGHPGVVDVPMVVRGFECPRCVPERGPGWWPGSRAVPLADGQTLVCYKHATKAEQRNRWCERCHRVLDQDEFDLIKGRYRYHRACRSCRTPIDRTKTCEHCDEAFTPKRADARFCSTKCRVAAHRARSS
jgi:hypothetical protein